jgi:hypothetical protein
VGLCRYRIYIFSYIKYTTFMKFVSYRTHVTCTVLRLVVEEQRILPLFVYIMLCFHYLLTHCLLDYIASGLSEKCIMRIKPTSAHENM